MLLILIYSGCSLLKEEEKESPLEDVISKTITGFWVESGDAPLEIIEITKTSVSFFGFKTEPRIVQKIEVSSTIDENKSQITITKPGQEPEIASYTVSGDTLRLSKEGSTKTYSRYSGSIPSEKWNIIPFSSGTVINSIPQGVWRANNSEEDQIVVMAGGTISLLSYRPNDATLYYEHLSYTVNSSKDSLLLSFGDGEKQAIPYRLVGGKLEVKPDSAYISFTPYSDKFIPQSWNFTKIKLNSHDDNVLPSISGTWVEKGRTRGMEVSGSSLIMHSYQSSDSSIYDSTYSYELTNDSIFLTNSGVKKGYRYTTSNDSLYLYFSGGEWAFKRSSETFPLSHWAVKSGTITSISGNWISTDGLKNNTIEIGTTAYKQSIYNPTDSTITVTNRTYTLSKAGDSLYLYSFEAQTDRGTIVRSENNITITMTDGISRSYTRYFGTIPLSHWAKKHTTEIPVVGKWLVKDGSQNRIISIHNDTLDHFLYNSSDSTFVKESYDCIIDTAKDSIYLKKGGVIVDKGSIQLNIGELFIQLGMWTKSFSRYDGVIPHPDWKLKTAANTVFQGAWLIEDGTQSVIMVFNRDTMIAVNYIAAMEMFRKDTLTFKYNSSNDSMTLFSDGAKTGEGTLTVSNNMLTAKSSDGSTTLYSKYSGSIPHPDWKIKIEPTNPLVGTRWITPGVEPEAILSFTSDSVLFWSYSYTDSLISKGSCAYIVTGKPDSITLIFPDEAISAAFRFENDQFIMIDSEGESQYTKYTGVIPYPGWVERKRVASDFNGTWVYSVDSSEVMTITNGKATAYVYYSSTDVIDTAYYLTRFTTKMDSIFLRDEYGLQETSFAIELSNGMLSLSGDYVYSPYLPYYGSIPLESWKYVAYNPQRNYAKPSTGILKRL